VRDTNLFSYSKNLFERICSIDELQAAFKAVKRNGGAAGIDGITVKDFGQRLFAELGQLQKDLERVGSTNQSPSGK
jgi:hypothetical protein